MKGMVSIGIMKRHKIKKQEKAWEMNKRQKKSAKKEH